jgi:hypothetical protein
MPLFGDPVPVSPGDGDQPGDPLVGDAAADASGRPDDETVADQLADQTRNGWIYPFLLNSAREEDEDPNSGIQITLEEEDQ